MGFSGRWCLMLSCGLVAGCVAFTPDYSEDLYGKLSDVASQLTKVQAQLSTSPGRKVDYAKVEPYFVAALADIQQSREITEAAALYAKGRRSQNATQELNQMIELCQSAIETDRAYYAANGQPPNEADNIKTVKDTCSVARNVEAMMKR